MCDAQPQARGEEEAGQAEGAQDARVGQAVVDCMVGRSAGRFVLCTKDVYQNYTGIPIHLTEGCFQTCSLYRATEHLLGLRPLVMTTCTQELRVARVLPFTVHPDTKPCKISRVKDAFL